MFLQGFRALRGTAAVTSGWLINVMEDNLMSMTYPTREPAPAANTEDAVFVPRYARTARSARKPVKTWMILAPLGALVVVGGAVAMMLNSEEPRIAAAPAEQAAVAPAPVSSQASSSAMTAAETPVAPPAPVETASSEPRVSAPVVRRAETPARRAPAVERPALAAREQAPADEAPAVEPTGPRPYGAVTSALNSQPATTPAVPATSSATPPPPAISVQPLD